MTRLSLALVTAACLLGSGLITPAPAVAQTPIPSPAASPAEDAEGLAGRLETALADGSTPAMGVLVIRDGRVAGEAVRGVRASDSADPVQSSDAWHIGSNAKAMTATLIARLVEQGRLSWTATLAELLPDTPMREEYRTVTLADLLSHRAGLRDLDDTADAALLEAAFVDTRALPVQRLAFAAQVLNEAPIGPVRADSVYSNTGYVLAGAIAERATGRAYEDLMQTEVFQPLGMTVVFGPARRGDILGHRDGQPLTGLRADNPPLVAPVGAVKLSLRDWAAFAIDQMAGEQGQGRLLSADSYRRLHQAQGETDAALGWGVRTDWPAEGPVRMISHAGSNGYNYALIALLPDRLSGVLIAANAGEGSSAAQQETMILMGLMRELAH